jgi:signal transduction histidine kinase
VANLTDTAIRYNVTDGKVEITAGSRDGRPFLAVSNSGPVIPPDQLSRLFQPFQRLEPGPRVQAGPNSGQQSSGQRGSGLGLGLAIVSAIAAAHGAELRAVTRAAGGLAVEVTFPPPPTETADRAQDRAQDRAGALV